MQDFSPLQLKLYESHLSMDMNFFLLSGILLIGCHAYGQMSFALPSSYPDSLKIKIKPYIQEKVKVKGYASVNEIGGLFGVWVTAFTYVMPDGIGVQASHPIPNIPIKIKRGSFGPFFAVRTSHGYQFNPKLYLGASVEMDASRRNLYTFSKTYRESGYPQTIMLPMCTELRYIPLVKKGLRHI